MDSIRRQLCAGLAATAASTITGCCQFRQFPTANSISKARAKTVRPSLAVTRQYSPDLPVVDSHAHFFNASDVPIQGYLTHSFGHSQHPVVAELLKLIAPVANWIATKAPTAKEEFDELTKRPPESWNEWKKRAEAELDEISRAFAKRMAGSKFEKRFNQFAVDSRAERGIFDVSKLDEGSVKRAVIGAMNLDVTPSRSRATNADMSSSILVFLCHMLSSRSSNLVRYQEVHCRRKDVAVVEVWGSLVDFDYWLQCPPLSGHDDQIKLHALISRLSGGLMKPLAAYNPWTDIKEEGASLRRCLEAHDQHGCIGVKIYPPMGYAPWNNVATGDIDSFQRPDLRKLDDVLLKMFETFADHGILVMSHTKLSKGRDYEHDTLADPDRWKDLLEKMRERCPDRLPTISLAHFGGQDQFFGPNDGPLPDWSTKKIATKVMQLENSGRVYGDLGFWSSLECSANRDNYACDRLTEILNVPLPDGHGTVADRVLFGTDWYMTTIEPHWATYLDRHVSSLRLRAPDHVNAILRDNAIRMISDASRPPPWTCRAAGDKAGSS